MVNKLIIFQSNNFPTFPIFVLVAFVIYPSHQYQGDDEASYEENSYINNNIRTTEEEVSGISKTLAEMGQPKERPKNITCHVCYSEKNPGCLNFSSFSTPSHNYINDGEDHYHHHWSSNNNNGFAGFPQQCRSENHVCSVRKFAFSVSNGTGHAPMKTFAVKRNCTAEDKCVPGCVVMGERTRIYVCSTCCKKDLCNTGNDAVPLTITHPFYHSLLSLATTMFTHVFGWGRVQKAIF